MKIDLKWLIVPAMPFIILATFMTMFALVGVDPSEPARVGIAGFSTLAGLFIGMIIAVSMDHQCIRWVVKIGGK